MTDVVMEATKETTIGQSDEGRQNDPIGSRRYNAAPSPVRGRRRGKKPTDPTAYDPDALKAKLAVKDKYGHYKLDDQAMENRLEVLLHEYEAHVSELQKREELVESESVSRPASEQSNSESADSKREEDDDDDEDIDDEEEEDAADMQSQSEQVGGSRQESEEASPEESEALEADASNVADVSQADEDDGMDVDDKSGSTGSRSSSGRQSRSVRSRSSNQKSDVDGSVDRADSGELQDGAEVRGVLAAAPLTRSVTPPPQRGTQTRKKRGRKGESESFSSKRSREDDKEEEATAAADDVATAQSSAAADEVADVEDEDEPPDLVNGSSVMVEIRAGAHHGYDVGFLYLETETVSGKKMFRVQKGDADSELKAREEIAPEKEIAMKEYAVGNRVVAILPKTTALKSHPRMFHHGVVQKVESSRAKVKFDSFVASWRKMGDIRMAE